MADDVSNIIKESIDAVLQNQQYSENKVSQWTSACLEHCIKRLTALNKPFKYVVTCIIMQKNGERLRRGGELVWRVRGAAKVGVHAALMGTCA